MIEIIPISSKILGHKDFLQVYCRLEINIQLELILRLFETPSQYIQRNILNAIYSTNIMIINTKVNYELYTEMFRQKYYFFKSYIKRFHLKHQQSHR